MTLGSVDLTVVIVVYNAVKFLEPCLDSLQLALSDIRHEIILVDNGSTDGSRQYMANLPSRFRVIVNSENRGFAAANNQGIDQAKGDFVLLLNPDTITNPGAIQALISFAGRSSRRVGAFGPTINNVDGTFQRQSIRNLPTPNSALRQLFPWFKKVLGVYHSPYLPHDKAPPNAAKVECLSGSAMMVKAAAFADVGLLDEDFFLYGEDIDFCKRLLDAGWESWFVPSPPIMHYGGASSENRSIRSGVHFYSAAHKYYVKHFARGGFLPVITSIFVLGGVWLRCAMDLAGLILRRRLQPGGIKPRL